MTSVSRDMTNFKEFPGVIVDDKIYQFPKLELIDSKGKIKKWQIFIALINGKPSTNKKVNWEIKLDQFAKITPNMYEMNDVLSNNAILWTEVTSVKDKVTRSAASVFDKVMNKGRANMRNQLQTAMISARDKYLKKLAKTEVGSDQQLYYPMLAEKYDKGSKHLKYPLYVQPKLDGNRCVCYFNGKDVVFYSRNKKIFKSLDYLADEIKPALDYMNRLKLVDNDKKSSDYFYVDGELYKHGKSLQSITSSSKDPLNNEKIEYHIYDCFYGLEDSKYEERIKNLQTFFDKVKDKKYIKEVKTVLANDKKEVEEIYKDFIGEGYEGAILRNVDAVYQKSAISQYSTRSKNLVKMKPKSTDEFEIINYTEGTNGKEKGAIIWVCDNSKGAQFNVTPKNMTYEERYKVYKDCQKDFKNLYLGKLLTVEYEDMSDDNVPLRAKGLIVRDYE